MSKSEYPKTKMTFQNAQQNGYEVTSQLHRDIQKAGDESGRRRRTSPERY